MKSLRLLTYLVCSSILASLAGLGCFGFSSVTGVLLFPTPVFADEISPALMESLKSIPVPHTKLFLKYHGELLEHNLELAPRCFECHQDKLTFCVSCHAVVYDEEEAGEVGEEESEDWERLGIGQEDSKEDRKIFEKLGIPFHLQSDD